MAQLVMEMPLRQAVGREDFMVSSSNATAMALLDRWPDWPDRRLALVGPEGAGKSHMAAIWASEVGARVLAARDIRADRVGILARDPLVVEDVDRGVDEAALFHLMNACVGERQGLLLTGRAAPSDWPVDLPDLASRLSAVTPAVLDDPDDALLSVILLKLFADRQLRVKPALIGWLLPRMERSHAAAARLVVALDAAALERGTAVNVALAREVMEASI